MSKEEFANLLSGELTVLANAIIRKQVEDIQVAIDNATNLIADAIYDAPEGEISQAPTPTPEAIIEAYLDDDTSLYSRHAFDKMYLHLRETEQERDILLVRLGNIANELKPVRHLMNTPSSSLTKDGLMAIKIVRRIDTILADAAAEGKAGE